jgi:lipopolysaccharide export system permease protein
VRLLDRYLLRELMIPLGYCLGGFLIFWTAFDLLGELNGFQQHHLRFGDVVEYYLVKTPELLVTVVPVALLLALLYALTNHARHQELTAMRAAGLGLWRICLPYFVVGCGFSLAVLAMNELWVPGANDRAEAIKLRREPVAASALGPEWQRNLVFRNERDRRIWNIGAFNRLTGEMLAPNLEWPQADGGRRRLAAERGVFTNGAWVFYGVREMRYPAGGASDPLNIQLLTTNELEVAGLSETPEQIRSEIKFSELNSLKAAKRPRLSLAEIANYERLHPHLGGPDRAKLATQFQGRLSEPWTCLVVVLVAVPFGAPSGRRNVFVGVASSIFIVFAYYVLRLLGLTLGTAGKLDPWLAAWLPNAVFAAAGVWLTTRVR